jgi:hypothetical protein
MTAAAPCITLLLLLLLSLSLSLCCCTGYNQAAGGGGGGSRVDPETLAYLTEVSVVHTRVPVCQPSLP